MKLEARQVRFRATFPWFTRRRLLFVGKRNTLQLLETALVIEGYLMRLFFPVLGFLFTQALSEWTTVTVDLWSLVAPGAQPPTIRSLDLLATGGGARFDRILLARTRADLPG